MSYGGRKGDINVGKMYSRVLERESVVEGKRARKYVFSTLRRSKTS